MSTPDSYEIFCVKYAANAKRKRSDAYIHKDFHDGPNPIDFFVWAAVSPQRTIVVDLGFTEAMAKSRGHDYLHNPVAGLELVGVDANKVEDVILTHMHYDHVGNYDRFPNATLHLQEKEMQYATGRHMCSSHMRRPYHVEDVKGLVQKLYEDKLTFHDGEAEIAPGFHVKHVGGHTMGHQVCRVYTKRGWVVLASDAMHFYGNWLEHNPFPIVYNVGEMIEGWRTCEAWAESKRHVIPGHDPLVLKQYPAVSDRLAGVAVRLDVEPADPA